MRSLIEYIYQGKNIPIREYIEEKLIVNKDYKSVPSKDALADNKWRELIIDIVDPKYADIDTDQKIFKKRLYYGS